MLCYLLNQVFLLMGELLIERNLRRFVCDFQKFPRLLNLYKEF